MIATLICSLLICHSPCRGDASPAGDCSGLLGMGQYSEAASLAKSAIRRERWDAGAHACLAMASYLGGKGEQAMRALREAEDSLPKEVLDSIHDRIWELLPELLAEKEHRDSSAMRGGSCLLRNVAALKGEGQLLIGQFYNPVLSVTNRHVRGYRCSGGGEDCPEVDLVCAGCELRRPEARIFISGYEVKEVRPLAGGVDLSRNVRYIKKILELEKKN